VKEIFIGSSNTDKKNSSEKPKTQEDIPVSKKSLNSTSEKISVKSNTSFSDFEKQLVIDDFNTAKAVSTSSSSKKSKKRTYERTATKNNDIIEIKEAGETVGGMDLKNRMTLNKKGAKQKKAEMEHGIGSVEWIIAGISK
jgi:cysteinyl-tRNA synthetase